MLYCVIINCGKFRWKFWKFHECNYFNWNFYL